MVRGLIGGLVRGLVRRRRRGVVVMVVDVDHLVLVGGVIGGLGGAIPRRRGGAIGGRGGVIGRGAIAVIGLGAAGGKAQQGEGQHGLKEGGTRITTTSAVPTTLQVESKVT